MSLDLIRKHNTWFTKGLLILLAITFVVGFGVSFQKFGQLRGVPQGTAAEVNGEKISLMEFLRARDNLYKQLGQEGEVPEAIQTYINLSALNQLIDLKLLSQKARDMGFRVTDEELSDAIRSNRAFQIDGQFIGAEAYKTLIAQSTNDTVGHFEMKYREEILAQKLINLINQTAKVTDEELFNIYNKQNEQVNLYFVEFSPEEYLNSVSQPTKQEISSYYKMHRDEFKTPELRRIRYFKITPDKLESKVTVTDQEIEAYYKSYPDEFRSEGNGTLPLSDVREKVIDKIKKQRAKFLKDDFVKELDENFQKTTFTELAHENGIVDISESKVFAAGEAVGGIPLQVVSRAFSLKKGEKAHLTVGNTIWIIEVAEVSQPYQKKLDEAEKEIIEKVKTAKAKESARLKAQEFLDGLNKTKRGIKEFARSKGVVVEETGFFSRLDNVPKINSGELKKDAFFFEKSKPVAPKVYTSGGRFFIVSLKEIQEPDKKEFEEKKEKLREDEIAQRRNDILSDWIQNLRKEAKIIPNETLIRPKGQAG
jgi:peptidyl-prolyl cis-trans isomerase D